MPRARSGFTLLEMVAVLAVLLIIGAVAVPTMSGYFGNTKQRAAADIVQTRLSEARAKAMERGIPFRVAINTDKTRIRVAPDSTDFSSSPADDPPSYDSLVTEDKLDEATIELTQEEGDDRATDSAGWLTVVTMRGDGSCKEARSAVIVVKQASFAPIQIQVRGLTGQTRTTTGTKQGAAK
ncbi:MAG: prepilin-type N-terminal cleavage/methylation domain-containing protein [Gemmataceae bacterium]